MTAIAARRLALVAAEPATPGGDRLERVRAPLRPEFLADVWQADGQVFAPPREHPLLGLRKCAVVDCEAGVRTPNTDLCKLCIEDFKASRLPMAQFTAIPTAVQRATTTPDEERRKDVWDLAVLGLSRQLDFTPISQAWLRETAKRWAEEELPQHRGRQAAKTSMDTVSVVGQLSACLRETRPDHGVDPAALSRRDIIAFTNRLAHRERTGTISVKMRVRACRDARRFLTDIRAMGLTRPGGVAASLPDDFIMGRQDIPSEPDPDEQGRDLPAWVLQILDANLRVLEERSGADMRRMTELMMDTGRRPDEICQLRLDCLTRDAHGKPVLIYTDSKNHRPGRRLPVAEATARVIASQQADVRVRFPGTAARVLPLFPRDRTNPRGTVTYSEPAFTSAHRQWVNSIAHLLVTTVTGTDGTSREQVFDRLAVIPHAYRHTATPSGTLTKAFLLTCCATCSVTTRSARLSGTTGLGKARPGRNRPG